MGPSNTKGSPYLHGCGEACVCGKSSMGQSQIQWESEWAPWKVSEGTPPSVWRKQSGIRLGKAATRHCLRNASSGLLNSFIGCFVGHCYLLEGKMPEIRGLRMGDSRADWNVFIGDCWLASFMTNEGGIRTSSCEWRPQLGMEWQ